MNRVPGFSPGAGEILDEDLQRLSSTATMSAILSQHCRHFNLI